MLKNDQIAQELFSIITEDNSIEEIKDILKLYMDSLKNTTLHSLLLEDKDYQVCRVEYLHAYRRYQSTDFTKPQRDLIDTILARKEESDFEHSILAYMAGLLDSYRILKNFGLTVE